jgi:hypothetical protein
MKPHDPVSIARPSTRFIPVLASSVPPLDGRNIGG